MRKLAALPLLVVTLTLPLSAQEKPVVQWIAPAGAAATLPFSPAVRVGNLLYLSGQLGTDSTGKLAPGGIEAETRQALTNIKKLLEANGSSMDQVVKCLVMLADIGEWARMNTVYVTFFPVHKPARSAFGATGLALGARLEIECIATLP
ncbi:MAG TPA: RidA family protein [Gemmatimonadales bacterium]|jgi:reactive intermediate/imine deaminase|nr:RidA family protein [Gemmatimonadales bacterium]